MSKLHSSIGRYTDNATVDRVLVATRAAIQQAIGATNLHAGVHPDVVGYREAQAALETLLGQADLYNRNYPLEYTTVNALERYLRNDIIRSQADDAVGWQNALREALEAWADLEDAREDNSRCQYCGLINGH